MSELEQVANIAAFCMLDLDSNLHTAHAEYLEGKIPHGTYWHVLNRHGQMCAALHEAGYTEKHPFFGFPVKPTIDKK